MVTVFVANCVYTILVTYLSQNALRVRVDACLVVQRWLVVLGGFSFWWDLSYIQQCPHSAQTLP